MKTFSSYRYKRFSPCFFQVFPSEKGWPFPKFYGACGRAIVMEDAGFPLDSFILHPWLERAELGLAVIKIAKQLTSNQDHWGLYLTEVTLNNFAVSNGTVRLEDASHILVVDLLESNIKGNVTIQKKNYFCVIITSFKWEADGYHVLHVWCSGARLTSLVGYK